VEARSENWRNRRRSRRLPAKEDRVTNRGRVVFAVSLQDPTFVVRPGLKEPSRRERPERAGTRRVGRVTRTNFDPITLIIKLRNILEGCKKRGRKIERRRGLDVRAAPRKTKIVENELNCFRSRSADRSARALCKGAV
jgi:hypothetical protein